MEKQAILKEINEIENAIACDESMSPYSFVVAQAEERLEYLKKRLADI